MEESKSKFLKQNLKFVNEQSPVLFLNLNEIKIVKSEVHSLNFVLHSEQSANPLSITNNKQTKIEINLK